MCSHKHRLQTFIDTNVGYIGVGGKVLKMNWRFKTWRDHPGLYSSVFTLAADMLKGVHFFNHSHQ